MKVSLRTALLITTLFGSLMAYFANLAIRDPSNDDLLMSLVNAFVILVSFCASGASIAFDRTRTRTAAVGGCFVGFVAFLVLGYLLTPGIN